MQHVSHYTIATISSLQTGPYQNKRFLLLEASHDVLPQLRCDVFVGCEQEGVVLLDLQFPLWAKPAAFYLDKFGVATDQAEAILLEFANHGIAGLAIG